MERALGRLRDRRRLRAFNAVFLVTSSAPAATLFGALIGGVVKFAVNRRWVFGGTAPAILAALKYGVISTSSALLNAIGVVLWMTIAPTQLAWWLARLGVFLLWSHPMQRDWVFSAKRN